MNKEKYFINAYVNNIKVKASNAKLSNAEYFKFSKDNIEKELQSFYPDKNYKESLQNIKNKIINTLKKSYKEKMTINQDKCIIFC